MYVCAKWRFVAQSVGCLHRLPSALLLLLRLACWLRLLLSHFAGDLIFVHICVCMRVCVYILPHGVHKCLHIPCMCQVLLLFFFVTFVVEILDVVVAFNVLFLLLCVVAASFCFFYCCYFYSCCYFCCYCYYYYCFCCYYYFLVVVALSAGVWCHHSPVKTELHCIHCLLTLPHCRLRFGLAARSVARDATLGLPFKMVKCLRL